MKRGNQQTDNANAKQASNTCQGRTAKDKPCSLSATANGFCWLHAPHGQQRSGAHLPHEGSVPPLAPRGQAAGAVFPLAGALEGVNRAPPQCNGAHPPQEESVPSLARHGQANAAAAAFFPPTTVATRAHGPHTPREESVPPGGQAEARSAVFPQAQEGSVQPQASARSAVQARSDVVPQHLGAVVHADFDLYKDAFLPSFCERYAEKLRAFRELEGEDDHRVVAATAGLRNVAILGQRNIQIHTTRYARISRYLQRKVIHLTKEAILKLVTPHQQDTDQAEEPPLETMEWFAVQLSNRKLAWISLHSIRKEDLQNFVTMVFHKEMQNFLQSLDLLIGLEDFKHRTLRDMRLIILGARCDGIADNNLPVIVMLGVPGTGKSTCMATIGSLYWLAGKLDFGHLAIGVAPDEPWTGAEIIHPYSGCTPRLVQLAVQDAAGGVFALDEAHSLCEEGEHGYGKEAIAALNGSITRTRDVLYIVAGYPEEMRSNFLAQDCGLDSRIDFTVELEPYTPEELRDICCIKIQERNYQVEEPAKQYLLSKFRNASDWSRNFGNGRAAAKVAKFSVAAHQKARGIWWEAHRNAAAVPGQATPITEDDVVSGFHEWFKRFARKLQSQQDNADADEVPSPENKRVKQDNAEDDADADEVLLPQARNAQIEIFKQQVREILQQDPRPTDPKHNMPLVVVPGEMAGRYFHNFGIHNSIMQALLCDAGLLKRGPKRFVLPDGIPSSKHDPFITSVNRSANYWIFPPSYF